MLGSSAKERLEALDDKVEVMNARLDAVMARYDRLSADFHRLSSTIDQVQQRLGVQLAEHRGQADRLAALRHEVAQLHEQGRSVAGQVADLQERSQATAHDIGDLQVRCSTNADAVADQMSRVEAIQETDRQHERSLDQLRADILRIEQQAAADLAELRTTNMALARVMLRPDGARSNEAVRREPTPRPLPRRPHETADQLAAPGPASPVIVEEEPAERQAAG